jgi:hypothetical protein
MSSDIGDRMLERVYSEFLEMPGLRLTSRQAQRLWGLDEASCVDLLESLVDARFLSRRGGIYARLTDGRVEFPRPRPVKAQIGTLMRALPSALVPYRSTARGRGGR